jgi:type II secretory pathway pseudopilin PulG
VDESNPSEPPAPGPTSPEPEPPAPREGFRYNLRELLIAATLIVLVLTALTPWYQQRRTLALVSRVRADMRSVATALEAYFIDNMLYPACGIAEGPSRVWPQRRSPTLLVNAVVPSNVLTIHSSLPAGSGARRMITFRVPRAVAPVPRRPGISRPVAVPHTLTTPVAYIIAYPQDPFADTWGATFGYFTPGWGGGWILWSPGPDRDENALDGPGDIGARVEMIYLPQQSRPRFKLLAATYDPTNGTWSDGDIIRTQR